MSHKHRYSVSSQIDDDALTELKLPMSPLHDPKSIERFLKKR